MTRAMPRPQTSTRHLLAVMLVVGALLAAVSPAIAASPNTSITSGPSGLISKRSATFRFNSNVNGATFQCRMDGADWSACSSPKEYKKLAQGDHAFRVRAKTGSVDPFPAVRRFSVDTISPTTTLDVFLPTRTLTRDVEFFYGSDSAESFQCRLLTTTFGPCPEPPLYEDLLPDRTYTLEVRARDAAGNIDKTPASYEFSILTLLPLHLETAEFAAAELFPSQRALDVPPNCAGSPSSECPNGTPEPPADQVAISSTVTVTEAFTNRYDVTAISDVTTLAPVKISAFGANCEMTMTSANGSTPTWRFDVPLNFVIDSVTSEVRIVLGDISLTNVEDDDFEVTGNFACTSFNWGMSFFIDTMVDAIADEMSTLAPFCSAPGPELFEKCPAQP